MIDRIIDFISRMWKDIIIWYVLAEYEGGFILRLGRFKRLLKTGVNWKIPFADDIHITKIVPTTTPLRAQTLTTKDGKQIVVSSIIKYQVTNVQKFLLTIWDSDDVLRDTTMGAIKSVIADTESVNIRGHEIEQQVSDIVQGEVRKYGVKVHRITFVDIGMVRSFRLITNPDEYEE